MKSATTVSRSKRSRPEDISKDNRNESRNLAFRSEGRAPARTYTIQAKEETTAPDVIAGTFALLDTAIIALIDLGSTHSYICTSLASEKKMFIESTKFDVKVSNSLGRSVIVNQICRKCPIKIWGYEFHTDLMLLPFDEFDVILGMDWLTVHNVVVNCKNKRIVLKCSNGDSISVETERSDCTTNMISVLKAQKLIHKGAEAYLAYILDTSTNEPKIDLVPTIQKFKDIFLKNYRVYNQNVRLNLPLK